MISSVYFNKCLVSTTVFVFSFKSHDLVRLVLNELRLRLQYCTVIVTACASVVIGGVGMRGEDS